MGRRVNAHPSGQRRPRTPGSGLSLESLACGLIVVALVAVPAVFNPRGQNAFGVVKAGLLEVLGLAAGVCAALRLWSERRSWRAGALTTAAALLVAAFGIATAFGVAPALSFFSDGPRHEGMVVTLALAAAAFAISTFEGEQLDAVVTAMIVGSIGPSIYAIVQTIVGIDGSAAAGPLRAGSTLGNSALFSGYLVTVIPVTAALAAGALRSGVSAAAIGLSGYSIALALQLTALLLARGRGAWLSLLVAGVAVGAATIDMRRERRRIVAAACAGAMIVAAVAGGIFVRTRHPEVVAGGTVQVRLVIWQHVAQLLGSRPGRLALGYGPEMLNAVAAPFYSSTLVGLEGEFSVPDRAHNDLLDAAVGAGLLGVAAVVALHLVLWSALIPIVLTSQAAPTRRRDAAWPLAGGAAAAAVVLIARRPAWLAIAAAAGLVAGLVAGLLRRSAQSRGGGPGPLQWLAIGLLAGSIAHFVEIQVGIATIPSRLVWWSCIGIAAALARRSPFPTIAGAPRRAAAVASLAVAVAVAAMAFAFWQPGRGFSLSAIFVLAATGAAAALPAWNGGTRTRTAEWAGALAIAATMIGGLAAFDAAAPRIGLIEAANWTSHQATASLLFFLLAGGVIGSALGPGRTTPFDWRRRVAIVPAAAAALLVLQSSARPARADLLARIAAELTGAQRWTDAGILEEQRVRLTPESDRAWSALGSIELDIARHADPPDRHARFVRAVAALAEARRRSPFNWFHVRNQASAERVWAAADREGRAAHLATADRLFGEAAALAPAYPRLWAEWGNVGAERGDIHDAFVKLERAAVLGGGRDAKTVADAILGATGFDIKDPGGRDRAAGDLRRQGFVALAALYGD